MKIKPYASIVHLATCMYSVYHKIPFTDVHKEIIEDMTISISEASAIALNFQLSKIAGTKIYRYASLENKDNISTDIGISSKLESAFDSVVEDIYNQV